MIPTFAVTIRVSLAYQTGATYTVAGWDAANPLFPAVQGQLRCVEDPGNPQGKLLVGRVSATAGISRAAVFDNLNLNWYVSVPVKNGVMTPFVGTSLHRAYVLYNPPAKGTALYHTTVRVGTLAAAQTYATSPNTPDGAARDQLVTEAVMAAFTSRSVKQVDDSQADLVGRVLKYYGDWDVALAHKRYDTTTDLLFHGDGNCEAWTKFFLDALKTQGISFGTTLNYLVIQPNSGPLASMFVKNWAVANPVATPVGPYRNVFQGNSAFIFVPNQGWRYNWVVEQVTKQAGIPAQGNAAPLAFFGTHVIAQLKIGDATLLYDPSYGTETPGATINARLLAYQNAAIAFYSLVDPNTNTVTLRAVNPTVGKLILKPGNSTTY